MPDTDNTNPTRAHRATYARDRKKGGYLIRVSGPTAGQFAGREVPVDTLRGTEHMEKLLSLLWTGAESGDYGGIPGTPVALYSFEAKPFEADAEGLPF